MMEHSVHGQIEIVAVAIIISLRLRPQDATLSLSLSRRHVGCDAILFMLFPALTRPLGQRVIKSWADGRTMDAQTASDTAESSGFLQ